MTDFGVPSLLRLLDPAQVELLQSLGNRCIFSDGETVHQIGDSERLFQIVVSGSIKLVRLRANG